MKRMKIKTAVSVEIREIKFGKDKGKFGVRWMTEYLLLFAVDHDRMVFDDRFQAIRYIQKKLNEQTICLAKGE